MSFSSHNHQNRLGFVKKIGRNFQTEQLKHKDVEVSLATGGSATVAVFNLEAIIMSLLIDCDARITTLMMRQSFFYVVLRGATTKKDKGEGRTKQLQCNIQICMLLFAGCNDDHIPPRNDQQHKYAKVEYGKYT
jgi:hypothetical protein